MRLHRRWHVSLLSISPCLADEDHVPDGNVDSRWMVETSCARSPNDAFQLSLSVELLGLAFGCGIPQGFPK